VLLPKPKMGADSRVDCFPTDATWA
jgi:hypothetical protein